MLICLYCVLEVDRIISFERLSMNWKLFTNKNQDSWNYELPLFEKEEEVLNPPGVVFATILHWTTDDLKNW